MTVKFTSDASSLFCIVSSIVGRWSASYSVLSSATSKINPEIPSRTTTQRTTTVAPYVKGPSCKSGMLEKWIIYRTVKLIEFYMPFENNIVLQLAEYVDYLQQQEGL